MALFILLLVTSVTQHKEQLFIIKLYNESYLVISFFQANEEDALNGLQAGEISFR